MDDRDLGGLADELEGIYGIPPEEALRIAVRNRSRLAAARANIGYLLADEPDGLASAAKAVVSDIALRILNGEIEIRTPAQARDAAKVFFDIARLEAGKSTSQVEQVTRDERIAEIQALRDVAAARAGADLRLIQGGDADGDAAPGG